MLLLVALLWLSMQEVTDPLPGVGVDHKKLIVGPEWQGLFEAGRNLTMFYKNQSYGDGDMLFTTASFYLSELKELENAVDDNKFRSLDAVWQIYLDGGPLHLNQIPYEKFISAYKWKSEAIDKYFSIIDHTRRIWGNLVEELQILFESDMVL